MAAENREEYLEAIYGLLEAGGEASTNGIARAVGVRAASATEMLKKLHDEGYIRHKPYRGVELTQKGLEIASKMKRKHRLLERFLFDVLGIRMSKVHEQACRMEHSLSDEATEALNKLMNYPKTCPDDHKPIPQVGDPAKPPMTLLSAAQGSDVKVRAICGSEDLRSRLRSMGIVEGRTLKVAAVEPFGGPLVIRVGNSSVSIGRGMASKIMVSP